AQETNTIAAVETGDTSTTVTVTEQNTTSITFGLDRIAAFREEWGGFPIWQYLASGIFIILAFIIAKLIDIFVTTAVKKWAARTKTTIDDLVIQLLHGPVRLLAFVLMLQVGLKI